MLKKTAEREILEQVAALIAPHLAHAETYGLHACHDLCIAWSKAMEADMPLESYQRSRDEARHAQAEAERSAKAIVDEARARAAGISKECDLECQRMRKAIADSLSASRKSFEALQKKFEDLL